MHPIFTKIRFERPYQLFRLTLTLLRSYLYQAFKRGIHSFLDSQMHIKVFTYYNFKCIAFYYNLIPFGASIVVFPHQSNSLPLGASFLWFCAWLLFIFNMIYNSLVNFKECKGVAWVMGFMHSLLILSLHLYTIKRRLQTLRSTLNA